MKLQKNNSLIYDGEKIISSSQNDLAENRMDGGGWGQTCGGTVVQTLKHRYSESFSHPGFSATPQLQKIHAHHLVHSFPC